MKKILLAFGSELLTKAVSDRLSSTFQIEACLDCDQVLDAVLTFSPDVMAVDFMMTGIDGIEIVRAAHNYRSDCRIMVVSSFFSDYIVAALEKEHTDYLLRIPCSPDKVAARLTELAQWGEEKQTEDIRIRNLLISLGFRMGLSGFRITEQAVKLYMAKPENGLLGQLYADVAQIIGGASGQVEKAIRDSVEFCWKHGDPCIWRMYFATGRNGEIRKPTNKEFLRRVVNCLRQEDMQMHKKSSVG